MGADQADAWLIVLAAWTFTLVLLRPSHGVIRQRDVPSIPNPQSC
jgi:hypothetical protein